MFLPINTTSELLRGEEGLGKLNLDRFHSSEEEEIFHEKEKLFYLIFSSICSLYTIFSGLWPQPPDTVFYLILC